MSRMGLIMMGGGLSRRAQNDALLTLYPFLPARLVQLVCHRTGASYGSVRLANHAFHRTHRLG